MPTRNEVVNAEQLPSPYTDVDYCGREYCRIRELIGSKSTTPAQWDVIERVATMMLLHCPEQFSPIMVALNLEITKRRLLINAY